MRDVSQTSLPLFDESPPVGTAANVAKAAAPRASVRPLEARQAHLSAARRLARQMRRFADRSAEQVRAGQQICRHLVAMLEDVDPPPAHHSRH